ncbi:FAD/NAD(P)-binding protein [Ensifer sp. ENS11]|uniref:FAD/NAD(P)-binding protein n=1 Tax=Ensifer sp. ENS11 TaxID=2769291 RepID=UPI001781A065|nr:FAD/NAD(P)-binding protein [Ensifer sp. ENS11]MBD9491872.1 FAD/NAD(P)-binding protein [Ensifer sp. ENS11]
MTVHGLFAKISPDSDSPREKPRIAIIGRGFSGIMMAIALMKSVRTAFHVHLFDPQPTISGGQVMAAAQSGEILNSRVRDLSVAAGQPEDFNDWLCANQDFRSAVSAAIPGFQQIFVPKSIFSDYVYQRFSEALTRRPDISMQLSCQAVLGLRKLPSGRFLVLQEEGSIECDVAVLATGFGIRALEMEVADDERPLVRARRLVVPRHAVLLGSGVRVVDRLLQMRDNGYAGEISAPDLKAPVIQNLFAGGLAQPDELGLGLAVSPAGEVLSDSHPTANLYAIGPLGLGSLPDIDLVPEIVTQTYAAARLIATRRRVTQKSA